MKKLIALLLTLLLVVPAFAVAEAKPAFTPGTYVGEGQGIRSTIKVEVTFSEDAITDIQVVEQGETRNVGDAALELIPAKVLETQSLAVDAVSSEIGRAHV